MKSKRTYWCLMSLASCMWLALSFASCSTSDAEEDMEEVVDTPTDDEGQDNGTSDEETALKDVSITVYDASNICGFGTDIDIFLDGNMEKVSATGVALSVSAENLEKEPKEWIHGIVDAPQPTPGLQTLRIKGLRGETTYYCRPFVRSSDDEYLWGEIKEFTTTEEVLFGQRTGVGNISVREAECQVSLNPYSALTSVYKNVKVSLQDVVLEDFQCSILYYETERADAEHYGVRLDGDRLMVNFTNLPPGAKVSFVLCVDCDGLVEYRSAERYSVSSRKITESGMVDLSLSVDWAACNLGAAMPWDTGNYYTYDEAAQLAEADPAWQLPTKENIEQLLSQCEILPVRFDDRRPGVLVSSYRNTIYLPFADTKDTEVGQNGYHTGYFWTSTPYFDASVPLDRSRVYAFRLFGMTSPGDDRYGLVELNKTYAVSVRPVCPK